MNILQLIKKRRTIREYLDKPIPEEVLNKIIEAGTWAPSAHNLQPWKFIVITDKDIIESLANILSNPSNNILTGVRVVIKSSGRIIKKSPVVIIVLNNAVFSRKVKEYGDDQYFVTAHISEIESIAAAVENMQLAATYLGIGMAWLTIPLFAKDDIARLLDFDGDLLAVLTLGYPAEKGKSAPRKQISEIVKYLS